MSHELKNAKLTGLRLELEKKTKWRGKSTNTGMCEHNRKEEKGVEYQYVPRGQSEIGACEKWQ